MADQHRNYQRELDKLINNIEETGKRPRLLLHACCAPCSSYVLEYLSAWFDIFVYFYNPNIGTREAYDKRANELRSMIERMKVPVRLIVAEYDPESFYRVAKGHEKDPERGERCRLCYELRLSETARLLKELSDKGEHFDYFCTTLSISPLKDAKALNDIGERIAASEGLSFLPSDFKKRNGYKRSIELSGIYGLYRQDYCGCVFSRRERQGQILLT